MDETERTVAQAIQGPILILIRGLPGSGKTYLAEELRTTLGTKHVAMLDPDAVDYTSEEYAKHTRTMNAEGVEEKLHPYRFLRAQAHRAITDHKIIIWNQPFTLPGGFERTIENLRAYAAEHSLQLPVLAVEIEIDPRVAKARIDTRKEQGGHGPSDGRFARFVDEYISFADKGQDHTVTIQGEDSITMSLDTVIQALHDIQK